MALHCSEIDKLAKTIIGIKARHLVVTTVACCGFLASVAAALAAYQQLGGPVPATRDYVDGQVQPVESFGRQTRIIVLNQTWWRLQEKIEEGTGASKQYPDNRILRDQLLRLKRDQAQVQLQLDSLERNR